MGQQPCRASPLLEGELFVIIVKPMPDELAIAHEGRLALVNGSSSRNALYDALAVYLHGRGVAANRLPDLHQLAVASDMVPTVYASCHTMMPAIRVACRDAEDQPHGVGADRSSFWNNRISAQTDEVKVCRLCAEEDLQSWDFSWFRRSHQIRGFDWCPFHGTTLHRIDAKAPFARLPHQWIADGLTRPVPSVYPSAPGEDLAIGRYIKIYRALLDRDRPFPASTINTEIAERAKVLGLLASARSRGYRLSDHVAEMVPAAWLLRHVPNWWKKSSQRYFPRLDVIVKTSGKASPGEAYVLALAVLYSCASEPLDKMNGIHANSTASGMISMRAHGAGAVDLQVMAPGYDAHPDLTTDHRVALPRARPPASTKV